MKQKLKRFLKGSAALGLALACADPALASSHREAPFITKNPKVDGTDFYMFRSYEPGRENFVTLIANYQPLQDAYGGPNYFSMDPDAVYSIKIDNSGDAREDIEFQFRFQNTLRNLALNIGPNSSPVSVALIGLGAINAADTSNLNVVETYDVKVVRDRRTDRRRVKSLTNLANGSRTFVKPVDNIGTKTIADYGTYAGSHLYNVSIPDCPTPGRLFVGQRKEGFVVNLGEVFDLVNLNPLGATNGESNTIGDKNVTTLALEVPIACLTRGTDPTIAAWTTASLPSTRKLRERPSFADPTADSGKLVQVSRLANPLVNEVVIGLKDKDKFNASQPKDDGQFATYVTNPTFPTILSLLFPVTAPTFPRTDLVAVFLTGVDGLNKTTSVAEMMRLNTSIAPTPIGSQNTLGVLGADLAGYPNGRRPADDVVDITLRAAMGVLLPLSQAPSGQLAYTDGAATSTADYLPFFPYLNTPNAGSPSN